MAPRLGGWDQEALAFVADGLTTAEAASRWGVSRNAARERIVRAMRRANAARPGAPAPTLRDVMERLTAMEKRLGNAPPRTSPHGGAYLRAQLEECRRELGDVTVADLGADDLESVELQRLHAALRCALLEAEGLIPVVKRQLAVKRRATLRSLGGQQRGAA